MSEAKIDVIGVAEDRLAKDAADTSYELRSRAQAYETLERVKLYRTIERVVVATAKKWLGSYFV